MEMSELIQLEDLQPEALGEVIRARAGEFDKATMRAVEHAWHAGRALLAAKKIIPHGQWGQWLSDNFEGRSHDTARIWMRLAANYESVRNLEDVKHGIKLLDEAPERQAKKAEREAKKLEAPPKPPAPATPAPPAKLERPAWLADPDELERPEEDDLSPLPRTNTHHTVENRRTPDARETDRVGIVPPDDPRTYHDGHWYAWSEDRGRMVAVTDAEILRRADRIRGQSVVEHAGTTSPVVEPTTEIVSSKPGKVPTVTQLRSMVEQRADIGTHRHLWSEAMVKAVQEWASYKQSLTGKAKIRSLEQWGVALSRIENVVMMQGWPAVADMIEKAIANGWQGWEHETGDRKARGMAGGRIYSQLEKAKVKYDPLPE